METEMDRTSLPLINKSQLFDLATEAKSDNTNKHNHFTSQTFIDRQLSPSLFTALWSIQTPWQTKVWTNLSKIARKSVSKKGDKAWKIVYVDVSDCVIARQSFKTQ